MRRRLSLREGVRALGAAARERAGGLFGLAAGAWLLYAGLMEALRSVREAPWTFRIGFVHVHPAPVDVRFQPTGFDPWALGLGISLMAAGALVLILRRRRGRTPAGARQAASSPRSNAGAE